MRKFLLFMILISLIWADGGIIPPQGDYEIYSSDQVALIKILPDSEELSILVKTYWTLDYNGFAWIVPLPSLPRVSEVDVELFTDLADLSSPYRYGGGCGGPYGGRGYGLGDGSYGGDYYDIIGYDTIGFLEAVLIHTDLAESLNNWLINNGYELPEGATEMFQDYIARDWNYFFVARADTVADSWYYGQNVGIKFEFATDTIVYPMKISSISSGDNNTLYLYVIGEHKMFFDDAELEYANRISAEELEAVERKLFTLYEYIKEGDYITKLKRDFDSPEEMTSDILIYQSPDDTEYRKLEEEDHWYFGFANSMALPLLIFAAYLAINKLKKKKRLL